MSPKEEGTTVTEEMMTLAQAKIKVQEMIIAKLKTMRDAYNADIEDAVFDDIKVMSEQFTGERALLRLALIDLTGDPTYPDVD